MSEVEQRPTPVMAAAGVSGVKESDISMTIHHSGYNSSVAVTTGP